MKEIKQGDSFNWLSKQRVTVRLVRTDENNMQQVMFHEIACEWSYHQLTVLGVINSVILSEYRAKDKNK